MAWLEVALGAGPSADVLEQHDLTGARFLGTWVDRSEDRNYCYLDAGGMIVALYSTVCRCSECDGNGGWVMWHPSEFPNPPRWLDKIHT